MNVDHSRRSSLRVSCVLSLGLAISACGGGGGGDTGDPSPPPPDQPPVASAGADQDAVEAATVTLSAAGSTDDRGISAFSWTQAAGPAVTLQNAESETATFEAPLTQAEVTLEFELTVTDDGGATDTAATSVTVHPNAPPELAIHFPCAGCRFYGDAISVSGTATAGADDAFVTGVDAIESVVVDAGGASVTAVVEPDGHWIARNVPVPGTATTVSLSVMASDRFGETDQGSRDISYGPTLTTVLIAHDPVARDIFYLLDEWTTYERLLKVDLATGLASTIYESRDNDTAFHQVLNMVIDSGSTRAIFNDISSLNNVPFGIVGADLNTGLPFALSDSTHGTGPELSSPWGMALDADDQRLVVYDRDQNALFLIDAATGNRTIVSDNDGTGAGPLFVDPNQIAVDSAKNTAIVFEASVNEFLSVDLVSGDRTPWSGTGDPIHVAWAADFDPLRSVFVSLNLAVDGVYVVDPAQESVTLHSASTPEFVAGSPLDLVVDEVADRYVLSDYSNNVLNGDTDRLLRIDPVTGERSLLFDDARGSGPTPNGNAANGAASLAVDAANDDLILGSESTDSILRIDVGTGDRELVSGPGTGNGDDFLTIRDIALDPAGNRVLVIDEDNAALMAADLATGDRSIISGAGTGDGPVFDAPAALAADLDNGRVFVADGGIEAIAAVELTTGERTILSDSSNAGPPIENPTGVALDRDGDRLLVTDQGTSSATENELIAVDLATGERTLVSGFMAGGGDTEFFIQVLDLVLVEGANRAIITSGSTFYSVDLATGDRSILLEPETGNGEALPNSTSIAYDPATRVLYTWDEMFEAVFAVDATTGDRVVVSK